MLQRYKSYIEIQLSCAVLFTYFLTSTLYFLNFSVYIPLMKLCRRWFLLDVNPIGLLVLIVFKQTGKLDILIPAISVITHIKIHCIGTVFMNRLRKLIKGHWNAWCENAQLSIHCCKCPSECLFIIVIITNLIIFDKYCLLETVLRMPLSGYYQAFSRMKWYAFLTRWSAVCLSGYSVLTNLCSVLVRICSRYQKCRRCIECGCKQ